MRLAHHLLSEALDLLLAALLDLAHLVRHLRFQVVLHMPLQGLGAVEGSELVLLVGIFIFIRRRRGSKPQRLLRHRAALYRLGLRDVLGGPARLGVGGRRRPAADA